MQSAATSASVIDSSIVMRRLRRFSHASWKMGKPPMSVAANASQSRDIQLRHQPVKLATITAAISASRTYSATPPSCSCADSCSSCCRRCGRVLNRADGSFEIAPDDANDFLGRFLLSRSRFVFRVEDVELDVVFDDFRHE